MDDWSDWGEVNVTPELVTYFPDNMEDIFKDSCKEIGEMSPKLFKASVVYRIDFVILRQNIRHVFVATALKSGSH